MLLPQLFVFPPFMVSASLQSLSVCLFNLSCAAQLMFWNLLDSSCFLLGNFVLCAQFLPVLPENPAFVSTSCTPHDNCSLSLSKMNVIKLYIYCTVHYIKQTFLRQASVIKDRCLIKRRRKNTVCG